MKDKEDVKAILRFTKVNVDAVKKQARKENTLSIFEVLEGRQGGIGYSEG